MKKELVNATMMINEEDRDNAEEVNIDGYVEYTVDTRYGEDADGNRGVSRIEVEDVTDIRTFTINGEEVFLNGKYLQKASDTLTRRFLEGD